MEPNLAKEWVGVLKDIIDLFKPKKAQGSSAPKTKKEKVVSVKKINLRGKIVVVTGTISMHRSEFERFLNQNGANLGKSVTGNTDLLIVGTKPGTVKIQDAKAKRIPFTSWNNFRKRI